MSQRSKRRRGASATTTQDKDQARDTSQTSATEGEPQEGATLTVGEAAEAVESAVGADEPAVEEAVGEMQETASEYVSEDGDGNGSQPQAEDDDTEPEATTDGDQPKVDDRTPAEKLADADADGTRTGTKAAAYDAADEADPASAPKASDGKSATTTSDPVITEAVKYARYELSGKNPKIVAKGKDAHRPGASKGQHIKVRARVAEMLEKPEHEVTVEEIVKISGLGSQKKLLEVATWATDTDEMTPLRKLSQEFRGDSWAMGRYLAAILGAWIWQIKAGKIKAPAETPVSTDGDQPQATTEETEAPSGDGDQPVATDGEETPEEEPSKEEEQPVEA